MNHSLFLPSQRLFVGAIEHRIQNPKLNPFLNSDIQMERGKRLIPFQTLF